MREDIFRINVDESIFEHRPKKIRVTSLLFSIGILLMLVNGFIDVTHYFTSIQPHTLGGAITAIASSIITQLYDS